MKCSTRRAIIAGTFRSNIGMQLQRKSASILTVRYPGVRRCGVRRRDVRKRGEGYEGEGIIWYDDGSGGAWGNKK